MESVGYRVTAVICPGCGWQVPVEMGDLTGCGLRTLDDVTAYVEAAAWTDCPTHARALRLPRG